MILDFTDEQLCSDLNNVLSGLLPHDNYAADTFDRLYPTLITILAKQDTRRIYFVFYTILEKYYKLKNATNSEDYQVKITKDRFLATLSNNLPDLILEPNLELEVLMSSEGKLTDLAIPSIQEEAMKLVYSKTRELYETCFELQQSYDSAMAALVNLKDSIKLNLIYTSLELQKQIISIGYQQGRTFYRGSTGWTYFTQRVSKEIAELETASADNLICDSTSILQDIEKAEEARIEGICEYGIPQLDDRTPLLQHRLVVLVARENVGKTQVAIHLAASAIRAGGKPYFASGESQPQSIFLRIVSSYILQEYGRYITPQEIIGEGFESLNPEEKQMVQTAKARCATSGLIISNTLEYDNVQAAFTAAYTNTGSNVFIIDHTQALRGRRGRPIGALVTNLALDCRELKNQFPVYILLTSQPSTNLKDILQKNSSTTEFQQSPTAQSAAPAQEADELFILNENPLLRKQNLLQLITYKRRGAPRPAPLYLKKLFAVSSYVYDENLQNIDTIDGEDLSEVIQYSADIDEEDEDDQDGISNDYI